jgi:hypothetical protein
VSLASRPRGPWSGVRRVKGFLRPSGAGRDRPETQRASRGAGVPICASAPRPRALPCAPRARGRPPGAPGRRSEPPRGAPGRSGAPRRPRRLRRARSAPRPADLGPTPPDRPPVPQARCRPRAAPADAMATDNKEEVRPSGAGPGTGARRAARCWWWRLPAVMGAPGARRVPRARASAARSRAALPARPLSGARRRRRRLPQRAHLPPAPPHPRTPAPPRPRAPAPLPPRAPAPRLPASLLSFPSALLPPCRLLYRIFLYALLSLVPNHNRIRGRQLAWSAPPDGHQVCSCPLPGAGVTPPAGAPPFLQRARPRAAAPPRAPRHRSPTLPRPRPSVPPPPFSPPPPPQGQPGPLPGGPPARGRLHRRVRRARRLQPLPAR